MQPYMVTMRATNLAIAEKTDRRRYPRMPVNRPARIRVAGGPPSAAQLMNVSPRGAALFFSMPLPTNTVVWVRLQLRTGQETKLLKLAGVVRQSHLFGESHLIRIAFTKPPLKAVQVILEYMKEQHSAEA